VGRCTACWTHSTQQQHRERCGSVAAVTLMKCVACELAAGFSYPLAAGSSHPLALQRSCDCVRCLDVGLNFSAAECLYYLAAICVYISCVWL
jgi:hypothetical protein